MQENSDFYIFLPLTTSLFYYPMLKYTKLEAVDGLKKYYKDRTFMISSKKTLYLSASLANNETSFSLPFPVHYKI